MSNPTKVKRRFPAGSLAGMVERKGVAGVLAADPIVKAAKRIVRRKPATTKSVRRERVKRK